MPSLLENLCGPGKPLHPEPPDAREFAGLQRSGLSRLSVLAKGHEIRNLGEYEGDLNVDERIVRDLIGACKEVAAKLAVLPPPQD